MTTILDKDNKPESGRKAGGLSLRLRRRRQQASARMLRLGLIMTVVMVAFAWVGPLLYRVDPVEQDLENTLLGPFQDWSHVLGTDGLGRDLLARLMFGERSSLTVAVVALLLGGVLGCLIGILAGYFGGLFDKIVMRIADAQLSIPVLIAAMFVSALVGAGFGPTVIAIAIAAWPTYARAARGEVLRIREAVYIEAGKAIGGSHAWILRHHVVPNLLGNIVTIAAVEAGHMVLLESSLSFVGLGIQPPDISLGAIIHDGQQYIYNGWWIATFTGFLIMLLVLSISILGDGLRDRFDPHSL